MCFDVYWVEIDLTAVEWQAYTDKVGKRLRARADEYPSILEIEARCPHCCGNTPLTKFVGRMHNGSVSALRPVICP